MSSPGDSRKNDEQQRSPGSSPFASPRSDKSADQSMNSPRFEQFIRGMRIPNAEAAAFSNITAASPPRFVGIDKFIEAATTAQNIALAHEISVNQNFKLEKLELNPNSLEKQVNDTVHKVFWDLLKEDLNKIPPDYRHTFVILNEAKQALMSLLLPNHTKLKEQIDHVLDMELIQQQMSNETFEYDKYANFICDVMSKLCAPVRDEEIARIKTLTDPIEIFKTIMQTLDLLKLDMANFTITQMRPHIQLQVVSYEQKKFKEFLDLQKETGIDGLEAAKAWLKRAHERIKEDKTIGGFKYESGPTASSITNEAYMEIFVWTSEYTFPESLSMDEMRFNEIYVNCRKFLVVCTIINAVYQLLGEVLYGYEALRQKLKQNILILLDDFMNLTFQEMMQNIGEEVIKLTNDALAKIHKNPLDQTQEKCIKSLIVDLSSKPLNENSVYRILFSRYIDFLQGILTKRTQAPVKLPQGMSIVEKDLIEITGQFLRLVSFNKSVFGNYYGEIIEDLKKNDENNL